MDNICLHKHRILLLFIGVFFNFQSEAQQVRFNKIYELDTGAAIYNIINSTIPIEGNKYFFSGNDLDIVDYNKSHFISGILDDTGKIVLKKKYYIDSVSNFFNEYSCLFHHNYFTAFCAYNRVELKYELYLYYLDTNLDTIWTRKLGTPMQSIAPQAIFINDKSNVVLVGGCNYGFGARGVFVEVDTLGNIINIDTTIQHLTQTELKAIIPSKTNNGYICAGIAYLGSVGQNFICGLDSLGHRTWYRNVGGVGEDGSLGIEYINDTTFLVSGFRRLSASGGAIANLIVITESNQLKRDYFPSTPEVRLQDIEKLIKKENQYFGYGYSQDVADSVVIFCMDTAFNFIWARYYYRNSGTNRLFDFRLTSDGGSVACGDLIGPLNQDGWVLKLDSLGCDVSNCWIKDTSNDTATLIIPYDYLNKDIKIYPNPIHDQLRIAFEYFDASQVYTVSIQNMLGQNIYAQSLSQSLTELELSTLAPALYICEIRNKAGMRVAYVKLLKE